MAGCFSRGGALLISERFVTAETVASNLGVTSWPVPGLGSAADFPGSVPGSDGRDMWPSSAVVAWAAAHPGRLERFMRECRPTAFVASPVWRVHCLARDVAVELNHGWIGCDHLLLALLEPNSPGGARGMLESLGLGLAQLRTVYVGSMGDPFEHHDSFPVSSGASIDALRQAGLRARDLGVGEATSEHVLLSLIDRWESLWLSIEFTRLGLDGAVLRNCVLGALEGVPAGAALPDPGPISLASGGSPPRMPELRPSPLGRDPLRRKPWASALFGGGGGLPLSTASGRFLQCLVDRDGYPVITTDGQPVTILTDDHGQSVRDELGSSIIVATEIPRGSSVRAHPGMRLDNAPRSNN